MFQLFSRQRHLIFSIIIIGRFVFHRSLLIWIEELLFTTAKDDAQAAFVFWLFLRLALAMKALGRVFCAGFGIRKAGVTLAALDPAESLTRRLWDDANYEHRRALMAAMDKVNRRFGHDAVRCGLYVREGAWRTRAEMLSPAYTTRWEDVCRVAA